MSDDERFPTAELHINEQYDAISAEVRRLSTTLRDADAATVAAEQTRLRAQADQIQDDYSREAALIRIEKLPLLIEGPQPGKSPQYSQALILVSRAHGLTGPIPERIAETERIIAMIGDLARRAPTSERGTIMRMNSSLARIISELRAGWL